MGLAKEADSYAEHAGAVNAVALTQQVSPEAARAIPSRRFGQSIGTAPDRMVTTGRHHRIIAWPGTEKIRQWRFR